MLIRRIAGTTHHLGAPAGWNPDTSGPCDALPVKAELVDGLIHMTSAWEPTPAELKRLKAGALVHLRVVGGTHPPVMIEVGEVPE